jgi:DNA polymerase-3 subunit delta
VNPPSQSGRTAGAPAVAWRDAAPAPVVLLSGPEEYLAARAAELVRMQVRSADPDLEVVRLDAGTYEAGALAMHSSPSLFGGSTLIEAKGLAQMNDAFLEDALRYLRDPAPGVVLVLQHSGGNRGKRLLDALKAGAVPLIDCQPLKKDTEKAAFVAAEFQRERRRIGSGAVRALVLAVGSQLAELAAACHQLMVDTTGEVTEELVEKYYGGRVEATAFKVADAALAGRAELALSTLRHALSTGVDPVPLVAALAMKMRAVARVLEVRGSSAQLAKELAMAPWQVEQARREAQRWSRDAVVRCMKVLAEADAQVKGASRDPVYAVERAVTTIALANRA